MPAATTSCCCPRQPCRSMQSADALRTHHATEDALPWTLDGVGLLPAALLPWPSTSGCRSCSTAAGAFIGVRRQDAAKVQLGDLYRGDYPSIDDLGSGSCDVQVWPLPDAGDFRVGSGTEGSPRQDIGHRPATPWGPLCVAVASSPRYRQACTSGTAYHRDADGRSA